MSDEEPPKGGEPADDKSEQVKQPDKGDTEQPEPEGDYSSGGSIEFQDAATTKPRPPTPAEMRARDKYAKKQKELEEARIEAEDKQRHQRRVLMGAAAAVGVVGLVAGLGYWMLSTPDVTAQCVQEDPNGQPIIVPDSYCTGHTAGLNGFYYFGGHQYHYYYGSSGSVGSRPIGGSTVAPKGANITTKSGTSISRGGLGGSSPGKSSGS
ncbi:hypothetical protein [Mycobacterium montefiorense]|uniref:Uncharacterized protein n=1 Tax=Mycobacterium montefiorense TaxID=154654 RepID=A0AA37PL61_9MYCO|nr:hypothetical protein [Mycobacterium montefiorense]GBG40894.1 hypothetical protein MmonteBS_52660 [Mycobacterium montefiorense]GKU33509.1 hypothetical protein NJB14191_08560 [Mycobacterium montefiorense]GKU40005.1 hypothetical protein NJB14192_19930 [Mycobacterium montefiorense]GKU45340.1 hypothetical protein NJB14194_19630 [Mycobacterium montefiorense]GKU49399.1 hypothetical protein NJB14195_06460 [Mycobacterium montefiorense]